MAPMAATAVLLAVLSTDLLLPVGAAGGVPYVLAVVIVWFNRSPKWIFPFAVITSVLVFMGYFFSPARGSLEMEISHRALALFVIWGVSALLVNVEKTQETLRDREEFQRSIMDNAVAGIVTIDEGGIVRSFNASASTIFGYNPDEVIGRNVSMLIPAPFADKHDAHIANYLRTGEKKVIGIGREVVGLRKNGKVFPLELSVSETHSAGQRMFTGFVHDLTERKQAEEVRSHADILEEMVRRDGLTGLFNRQVLLDALEREVERSRRYGFPLSIHMIDLDHFKRVNDTHGHIVGDDVLARSGRVIQSAMRASDVTARYGGEEFCIILPQTDFRGAVTFAERVHRQITAEVYSGSDNEEFRITCSIGVAEFDPESDDATSFLDRADQALYQAKNSGRNRICPPVTSERQVAPPSGP